MARFGHSKPIGGAEERISCRVNYAGGTAQVSQKISCAGTDYKFEASAEVNCNGNSVSGTWTEKVANNTGSVNGTISGDRLNIDVEGPNFKGRFNVRVTGASKHSLTITQFDPGAGRAVPVATDLAFALGLDASGTRLPRPECRREASHGRH